MQNWTSQVEKLAIQEDQYLLKLFEQIQVYNRWKEISKKMNQAGFSKSQLDCRNRYHNKLNPNLKFDEWTKTEIQKIFKYYDQYGSKWNLIETFLPGRTQNNIKNRFFSTLKNLVRKLLKKLLEKPKEKKLQYISSRDITDLYEGRGRYKKFQGFLKKILKQIDFQIEVKMIIPIIEKYYQILKELMIVFVDGDQLQIEENQAEKLIFIKQENQINETKCQFKNQSRNSQSSNELEQSIPYIPMNQWTYYPQPIYYGIDQSGYSFMPVYQPNVQPMLKIESMMQNNSFPMLFPTSNP